MQRKRTGHVWQMMKVTPTDVMMKQGSDATIIPD
jgi:hypothetical protein